MRTNIVIDDTLMEATLKATGLKTKREAVEQGLRTLHRLPEIGVELRKSGSNWISGELGFQNSTVRPASALGQSGPCVWCLSVWRSRRNPKIMARFLDLLLGT